MAPFFKRVKSFHDVPTEPDVETESFLQAAEGVVELFNLLGSTAFYLVVNDLKGNITKVRNRLSEDPVNGKGLKSLVDAEIKAKQKTAAEGLLWLLRGLEFTCKAMYTFLSNPALPLSDAFSKAYEDSLRAFHNFVVRSAFSVALKACPTRQQLLQSLTADPEGGASATQEEVNTQIEAWTKGLDNIVKIMKQHYEVNKYKF
ncbi:hypothetical protein AX16_006896 [Volvariella volvacea WC 439]|nr:hypothetical protein AX16_006896 [Volvariella volvacea WC 439]